MKISRNALRGYILEEILAYLIRNTGYRLLVDENQDPDELGRRGNGLVVKGRGAAHQVDVLGELSWIPAFTYPLRLFIEAKFRNSNLRKTRTGIDVVRNMVATLLDVNQNNLPQVIRRNDQVPQLRPKYHYAGAIFSTSGFARDAMDMALAHSVSLIDLGSPEFNSLLSGITSSADSLIRSSAAPMAEAPGPEVDTEDLSAPGGVTVAGGFLKELRIALRSVLGTQPSGVNSVETEGLDFMRGQLLDAVAAAREIGELFVGMARGPHMLVLKAEGRERFLDYSREHPSHEVWISWSEDENDGRTWRISPLADRNAYSLTFRIPDAIGDWIFSSKNIRRAAINAKEALFSNITIYRHENEKDSLIRLRFNRNEIPEKNG